MVAVVSGSGLGFFNSSNASGNANVGRGRDQVIVNTTTGNLVVQAVDDTLSALGLDFAAIRTYNSQGLTDEDNNDQWRLGVHQKVSLTSGTVNTAGSVVTKTFGDGTEVKYTWNTTRSRYESTDGDGANDYLTWNSTNSTWTWTDASSRATEEYGLVSAVQRIKFSRDADGNTVTYNYTGSLLTSINMAGGTAQTVNFDYTGNNLTAIRVISNGVTQTLTRYYYDTSNRLKQVVVDLTPADNAVPLPDANSDGYYEATANQTYITSYTYDGTSKRIATIQQSDGSQVTFTYQNLNGDYRLKTMTDGENRLTTFNYSSVVGTPSLYQQTDVVDSLGLTTTYLKDAQGRLISVQTPAVGGARIETRYTYDPATGNVATIVEDPTGLNRVTTFTYDANTGLLLSTRDSAGNTVARTYNANNQLETETSYLLRDPDGAGTGQPSSPLVSRYLYDSESHLRFVITADGRVTEHIYNTAGDRTTSYKYAANSYSGTYTESALNTWATGQRGNALERSDYSYDFRSNISTLSRWAATTSSGAGTGTASVTRFVYDQRGVLVSTVEARGEATSTPTTDYLSSYTYDGLGRMLTTTSWVSGSETARLVQTNSYDDANRRTVSTFANGLTRTATFDKSGALLSLAEGPAALGTTTYTYDAGGRPRVVTDATNLKSYLFYDDAGRKVGGVDGDGSLVEFVYNRASQVIKTIRYATRLGSATLGTLATSWGSTSFATLRTEANATPAANQISRNVYDAAGLQVYEVDEIGGVTQNIYDGAGRLTDQVRFFNTQSIAASVDEVLPAGITVASNAADRRTRYFYNGDGALTGTLDGAGYLKENIYDAAGRLSATIGYFNASDSARWLTGTLDTLRPGSSGSTAQLDAARDITTRYFYDAQGRQVGELDGERYLTESVYDVAGNVTQLIRYNAQLTFTPGTSTFATLKSAAASAPTQSTVYTYDGLGQLLTETNFEGTQTLYSYDLAGNVITTTRANGVSAEARTTATRYDALGRVTQELSGEGSVALAALGASPTQVQINDIWDKYGIAYVYDAAGRRISMTVRPNDSQTQTTYYYYDNDGRLRFEMDARGQVVENRYNALGQITDKIVYWRTATVASPTGGLLTTALISALTASESANVHEKTTYTYSLRGEVTATTTAAGATTTRTWNVFGELQSENAGSGFTATDYTYDARGLQKLTRRGSTTFQDRTYDAFGRLATVLDARGNSLATTYDRLGREVTSQQTGDPAARLTTYDGFSRVLTVRDKLNNTTNYAYNDTTRTVTVTTPESIVVSTVHNRHGDTVTVTANGNTTSYTYDRNGRLTAASDGLGALEGRSYDRIGRQVSSTDARATVTTLAYDTSNRVITRTVDSASGGLQLVTSYAYDASSRIMNVTEPGGRLSRTQYDRDGRVTSVIEDPNGATPRRTDYGYDAANNLLQVTEGVGSANPRRTLYVFDALGRRTDEYVDPISLGGTLNLRTQYVYDNNDNVTRKIDAKGNSTWYVYDAQNRVVQTIDALGGVTQNSYDGEDRLTVTRRFFNTVATGALGNAPAQQSVTTSVNDQVARTVYDRDGRKKYTLDTLSASGTNGTTELAVVTERSFDAAGNVTRTRIYRNAITVPAVPVTPANVASALTTAGNDTVTLHADDRVQWTAYDLRGRAVFTVDGTGAVVKTEYDLSGNVRAIVAYATSLALSNLMTTASLTTWSDQSAVANYPRNRVTRFWYDTLDRQRFSLDGEGYLTETRYLDASNQQQRTVYAGKPTIAAGATLAQVVTAAAAAPSQSANQVTTQTVDVGGRITQATDANGKSEYFVYDALGNKIQYVNKKAASASDVAYTWTYEYDAAGRLAFERSPSVTYSSVDPGTLAVTDTTAQVVTRNEYDALGNVTARTEAYGTAQARITRYEYDLLGRQTASVTPTVGIYTTAGDTTFGNGSAVAVTETQSEVRSETTYDVFGNAFRNRLVTSAEAATASAGTFSYKVYDNLGRVRYEVDARNYVTSYVYDAFGNKLQVTRHANALSSTSTWQTAAGVATSQVSVSASATADRTITSTYDRQGRALSVKQPSLRNFAPTINAVGGSYYNAQPTTGYLYNAFGDVIRTSVQINSTESAVSYAYYDRLGQMSASLDAGRHLTTIEYDESGDVTRVVEYARPTTGAVDVDTYGTIVTTTASGQAAGSADSFAGYDRETTFTYDKLNRKTSESKRQLEYASISSGTLSTQFNGVQTTTYGYDVLGNQVLSRSVNPVDGTNINTYTGYDVLGRMVTVAQPSRDTGNGNIRIPLTQMKRDAHGNLIQQIEFYYGAGTLPTDGTAATASSPTPSRDRTTTVVVDNRGNAIRTRDATDADRYASYNIRGDIAKEWQVVVNPMTSSSTDDVTETIVKIYRYDAVGQTTNVVESQRFNGASTDTVTRVAEYNAFGEITYKYNAGTADAQKQYFDYDQAGRVWRTNNEDGVDKVYMYDLAGNATLELRSKDVDLSAGRTPGSQGTYTSAQSVLDSVAAASLMRTETVYDAKGNAVQRRMPTYDVDSRFPPVATDINVNTFSGTPYVYWTAVPQNAGVLAFGYRVAGSTGNFTALTIASLAGGLQGVNVNALTDQTYEFRLTAGFAGELMPAAESMGTFRVDRTIATSFTVSRTAPNPAADIPDLQIVTNAPLPVTATFQSASFSSPAQFAPVQWWGGNIAIGNYADVGSGSIRIFVDYYKKYQDGARAGFYSTSRDYGSTAARTSIGIDLGSDASQASEGGVHSIARFQIFAINADGSTGVLLRDMNAGSAPTGLVWNAPADTGVTAVFRYKRTTDSGWSSDVAATRVNSFFRIDAAALLTGNATYNYQVEYWKAGSVIARKEGEISSTGQVTTRNATGSLSNNSFSAFNEYVATPTISGLTMSWAPPSQAVTASFEWGTSTSYGNSLSVSQSSPYSVNLASIATPSSTTTYNYRILYRQGNRLVSQQVGTFSLSPPTSSVSASASNGSPPATVPAVATVSGSSGVTTVTVSTVSASYSSPAQFAPVQWWGGNVLIGNYASVGSTSVRVVAEYYKKYQDGTRASWYSVSKDFSAGTANTQAVIQLASDASQASEGGVHSARNFRVYAINGDGSTGALLRDMSVSATVPESPRLTWAAPSDSSLVATIRIGGGSAVQLTASGGVFSYSLAGISSNTYTIDYTRSGDGQPIVSATGSFTNDGSTVVVTSQTNISRNPSWIGVSSSGASLSWSAAAESAGDVSFRYRVSGGGWQSLTPSGGPSYTVTFPNTGVNGTTNYEYEVRYIRSGQSLPYVLSTGTVAVTVTANSSVGSFGSKTDYKYPMLQVVPTLSGDTVSWSFARENSGDSIMFRYIVNGTTYSQAMSGNGPSFSAVMSQLPVGSSSVTWSIEYNRSGESTFYAYGGGSASMTVTQTTTPPTITVLTQRPVYPSGVAEISAPYNLTGGYLAWDTPSNGATVAFRYNGTAVGTEAYGSGHRVNLNSLGAGTYNYEITYTTSGVITARAIGTFTVVKTAGGVGNMTRTISPGRIDTAMSFVPTIGVTTIVDPPYAVYHQVWSQVTLPGGGTGGGYILQYGAMPWAPENTPNAGGFYYHTFPNEQDPDGAWNQVPQANYFYGDRLAIAMPIPAALGVNVSLEFWSLATPTVILNGKISNPSGDLWVADIQGAGGIANGNYGYRIKVTRQGALAPVGVQEGTFVVGSTNSITVGASSSPAPVAATPTSKQLFDRWGNVIQVTDAANNITDYRYNGLNLLVQTLEALDYVYDKRDAAGIKAIEGTNIRAEKTNSYDLLGRLIETQDGYDQASRATYNAAGQLVSKRNADYARYTGGATSANVYDTFGNLLQTQDELGYLTRYKYNKLGQLTETWREIDLNVFTNRTDATSIAVVSAAQVQTQFYTYDQAGRRISETNGANETIRYRYDFFGNVSLKRTNLGYTTTYAYNADGKKITETDALSSVASWNYDAFGQLLSHTEFQSSVAGVAVSNGTTLSYSYNFAGQRSTQSGGGTSITWSYDRAGNLASIIDGAVNRLTTYRYDVAGRQARETVVVDGRLHQDTRLTYDNHNRIKSLDDPDYRERFLFDVNGNRAYVIAVYPDHERRVLDETYTYTYDEMNRVSKTVTYLRDAQQNFTTDYTYNARGDRIQQLAPGAPWEVNGAYYKLANGFSARVAEQYNYDGLGRLKTVYRNTYDSNPANILVRSYSYDLGNRQKTELVRTIEGTTNYVTRNTTTNYDGDGRTTSQTTTKSTNGSSTVNESSVSYGSGSSTWNGSSWGLGFDANNNLRGYEVQFYTAGGGTAYKTTFKNDYYLGDNYLERIQTATSTGSGAPQPGLTERYYNVNDELIKFRDQADAKRTRYFVNNQAGQVLTAIQTDASDVNPYWNSAMVRAQVGSAYNTGKAQYFFYAQNNQVGSFGQSKEGQRYKAHFDVNSTPISDNYPAATPASAVAQAGDTLRTVAARVFGDASLWYVLAEENGLSDADADLPDGMQLRVPNDVISLSNTANSFKPFNVADALGDITPTQPPPPAPKGCGVIGMIILIVVMVVVTVFTAGAAAAAMGAAVSGGGGLFATGLAAMGVSGTLTAAAGTMAAGIGLAATGIAAAAVGGAMGSIVSQGVGIAIGAQDKFSWSQVGISAISAGVTAGLGGANVGASVARSIGIKGATAVKYAAASINAAAGSMLTQGISVATGLQEKFSWRSVAQAAVAAPLAKFASDTVAGWTGGEAALQAEGYNFTKFATDAASRVVSAGVRAAMGGRFDVVEVAADVFGNAIANAIVDTAVHHEKAWSRHRDYQALGFGTRAEQIQILQARLPLTEAQAVEFLDSEEGIDFIDQQRALGGGDKPLELMSRDEQMYELSTQRFSRRYATGPAAAEAAAAPGAAGLAAAPTGLTVEEETIYVYGIRAGTHADPTTMDTVAGLIDTGARAVNRLVNIVGADNLSWGMTGLSFVLGGPARAIAGLVFDKASAPLVEAAQGWLSDKLYTYVFQGHGTDASARTVSGAAAGAVVTVVTGFLSGRFENFIGNATSYVRFADRLVSERQMGSRMNAAPDASSTRLSSTPAPDAGSSTGAARAAARRLRAPEGHIKKFDPWGTADGQRRMARMSPEERRAHLIEYNRQLYRQERALNEMSADEFLTARANYTGRGSSQAQRQFTREFDQRVAESMMKRLRENAPPGTSERALRDQAMRQAREARSTLAALHEPDGVIGGTQVRSMGDRSVNSAIGGGWNGERLQQIEAYALRMRNSGLGGVNMQVRLGLETGPR